MANKEKSRETKSELTEQRAQLPAELTAALDEDAGVGISTKMEDNVVPLVYLLQANSKAALKGHDKYVPGAEGGSIWLRNEPVEESLIDGEEGMDFLPCYFAKCWIEWMPERGGFVARHADRPVEARLVDSEGDDGRIRKSWQMPNGNTVNESREFSGFVKKDGKLLPYTIPLSGSGHMVGRNWMTALGNQTTPSGKKAPIWAYYWHITTKLRTVGENSWYQYNVARDGIIQSMEERDLAKALNAAFVAGEKTSAAVEDHDGSSTATEVDDAA
jgi:hypothetical protein